MTDNSRTRLLDRLFPEIGLAEFLCRDYPFRPQTGKAELSDITDLIADPVFDSPHGAIRRAGSANQELTVYTRNSGTVRQINCSAQQAVEYYKDGGSVSIEFGPLVCPTLGDWHYQLIAELGLPPEIPWPAVLISPPGSIVPMHCDGIELIVLQLRGKKSWFYSENVSIENCDFTYFPTELGPGPRGGGNPTHRPVNLPHEMPSNAIEFEMEPGSSFFLPRGWWHRTVTLTASINVVFRIPNPSASSLVARALEERLRRIPRWRTPIPAAAGHEILRPLAIRQLRTIVDHLASDVDIDALTKPEVLLSVLAGPYYTRSSQHGIEIDTTATATFRIVLRHGKQEIASADFDWALLPVAQRIAAGPTAFFETDLTRQFDAIALRDIVVILRWLMEFGVLNSS